MKRVVLVLSLVILCLAAVGYRPARVAWERHTRAQARQALFRESKPLVLDAVTQSILSGADRVETFRLADFHEEEDVGVTAGDRAVLSGPHAQFLDDHAVLRVGPPQGRAFGGALGAALARVRTSPSSSALTNCFDPGVAFRVWKGQAHTDLCVCFYCEGIQTVTKDARHQIIQQTMASLGDARPAFLALSRQAFPDDKPLAALKETIP